MILLHLLLLLAVKKIIFCLKTKLQAINFAEQMSVPTATKCMVSTQNGYRTGNSKSSLKFEEALCLKIKAQSLSDVRSLINTCSNG